MMYSTYDWYEGWADATRAMVGSVAAGSEAVNRMLPPLARDSLPMRMLRANAHLAVNTKLTHSRPDFGIDSVEVSRSGRLTDIDVKEQVVDANPFCSLLRFTKPDAGYQPRVLLVAPMSGHFGTLLRETVRTMVREHDLYFLDWHNARDIPLSAGRFGLDDYVLQVRQAIVRLGGPLHVMAVCQPAVPVLAAVSLLAQEGHDAQPKSMTLMAGPIDTRVNRTEVNEFAEAWPMEMFERALVTTVPRRHMGAGRRVYPGFLQVSAFMGMNLNRHVRAHARLWGSVLDGDATAVGQTRRFYDEYFAVSDLDADYYLETVQRVFQDHELARDLFEVLGVPVEPSAIERTALLTVEGENDDICSVGQTESAHRLCSSLPDSMRAHHVQPGVGHYGVFSGSRWDQQIHPRIRDFVATHD